MGLLIETQHIVNNRKRVIRCAGNSIHLQIVYKMKAEKMKAGDGNSNHTRPLNISSEDI